MYWCADVLDIGSQQRCEFKTKPQKTVLVQNVQTQIIRILMKAVQYVIPNSPSKSLLNIRTNPNPHSFVIPMTPSKSLLWDLDTS